MTATTPTTPHISKDPLHGKTLQAILEFLVETHDWEDMGRRIKIKCFTTDPSIKSSLTFLRKTPWARQKVEMYYLATLKNETHPLDVPTVPMELD